MVYEAVLQGLAKYERTAFRINLDALPVAFKSGKRSSPLVLHERSNRRELDLKDSLTAGTGSHIHITTV